jgi:hypothetical protein
LDTNGVPHKSLGQRPRKTSVPHNHFVLGFSAEGAFHIGGMKRAFSAHSWMGMDLFSVRKPWALPNALMKRAVGAGGKS